jgi:hypothetical protein
MSSLEKWLFGLLGAFISGGAGAITSTITASVLAPDKFNIGSQLHSFLVLAGATFVINGILGAALFLKQFPVPVPPREVWTDEQRQSNLAEKNNG